MTIALHPTRPASDPRADHRPIGLAPDQLGSFARDGFIHLRGVIGGDELALLRTAADEVCARAPTSDHLFHPDPASGRPVLHRVNEIQEHHAAFLHLWGHPRLLAIAESLQGRDLLPLAQALVVKTPGFGAAVPWHRDPAHCSVRHGVNFGIHLDDADAGNGMLHVVPGTHRRRGFDDLDAAVARHGFDLPGAIAVPTRAGDVIIHSENVLHGSREVRSPRQRRVVYFGVRSIPEQLADRGLDLAWVRSAARILLHAIACRAASEGGRGEEPFAWAPTTAGTLPEPSSQPLVLRNRGGDDALPGGRPLGFDDAPELTAR